MQPIHIKELNEHISLHRQLTESLINEKKDLTSDQQAQEKESVSKLAKALFDIQGDAILEKKIDGYIEKISSLGVGRKLFQALAEKGDKFSIKQGENFWCTGLTIEVGREEQTYYNTINRLFEKCHFVRPSWVDFAHELVHVLHHSNPEKFGNYWSVRTDILPGMDDLNEQHVIAGFNSRHFSKRKTQLEPIEVICENAFLLALKLPPRIDHQKADGTKLGTHLPDENTTDLYFSWVEKELHFINQIPEDKSNDVEYILNFVKDYPSAIKSIPDKLNDETFMLRIIRLDINFLQQSPSLCNNPDFILKAMGFNSMSVLYSSPELRKNKEFIMKAATIVKDKIWKEAFLDFIDPSLQNDPDVKQVLVSQ